MMHQTTRVAAIHDLSGFGRCSLTVILPVLSAMGVQVCPVPTAIFSTHLGGLGETAYQDLTGYLEPALGHYRQIGIDFSAVYSGFLSTEEQIDHCLHFFQSYPHAMAVVDPVMGDHGKPYRTCTPAICRRMAELVAVADIITPNLTEAAILLKRELPYSPLTREESKSLLLRLSELGPRQAVVTGVKLATGEMANIGYDREKNAFWAVCYEHIPVSYPGTGDILASVLTGGMLTGDSLPMALDRATRFIELCIKTTFGYGTDPRYGVLLEPCLPELMHGDFPHRYHIL